MPKFDVKAAIQDLNRGRIWPIYWVYGPERYKAREFFKHLKSVVLGKSLFREETLEGAQLNVSELKDHAQSLVLGGGTRLIVVRDAELLKQAEGVASLCTPPADLSELTSVCVFFAKDLDGRKKISKLLVEKAAVISCDEVLEAHRENWIRHLASQQKVSLPTDWIMRLATLEPWSLELIEHELEKYALSGEDSEVFSSQVSLPGGGEGFMEAFFSRDLKGAFFFVKPLVAQPEQSLLLLGLLTWNVRQLALLLSGQDTLKLNPYAVEKLKRWSRNWKLHAILGLQKKLAQMDYQMKQTPLMPLGLWSELLIKTLNPKQLEEPFSSDGSVY